MTTQTLMRRVALEARKRRARLLKLQDDGKTIEQLRTAAGDVSRERVQQLLRLARAEAGR